MATTTTSRRTSPYNDAKSDATCVDTDPADADADSTAHDGDHDGAHAVAVAATNIAINWFASNIVNNNSANTKSANDDTIVGRRNDSNTDASDSVVDSARDAAAIAWCADKNQRGDVRDTASSLSPTVSSPTAATTGLTRSSASGVLVNTDASSTSGGGDGALMWHTCRSWFVVALLATVIRSTHVCFVCFV
jgi:hypothetical protein